MTADNVEQLMEIVRAIQRGEEPQEALRKKEEAERLKQEEERLQKEAELRRQEEERAREAGEKRERRRRRAERSEEEEAGVDDSDEEMLRSGRGRKRRGIAASAEDDADPVGKGRKKAQVQTEADAFDDDDEFEKLLRDDDERNLELGEKLKGAFAGLAGLAGAARERLAPRREAAGGKDSSRKSDTEEAGGKRAGEEEQGTADAAQVHSEPGETVHKPEDHASRPLRRISGRLTSRKYSEAADPAEQPDETEQEPAGQTEDQKAIDRLLDGKERTDQTDGGAAEQKTPEAEAPAAKQPHPNAQKRSEKKKRSGAFEGPASFEPVGIRGTVESFFENLRQKGIARRELAMIAVVLVLAVLIVVFVVKGISGSVEEKKKSEHVTADEGLTVTVEQEPQDWCASYPIALRFRASGAQIKSVLINGTSYTPDENGVVAFTTKDWMLTAAVSTDQGELGAQIEVPMVDSEPPVVNVSRADTQIVLTGADARSKVEKLRYAAVPDSAWEQLPVYQDYAAPIPFEENTTYYFYAEDQAGNRSVPVVTTMETAESLSVAQAELVLSPGEKGSLKVEAAPQGALLNNLRYESADPAVASVDNSGTVTAVSEGTATIRVSADGVETVVCSVNVSRERTVTVSTIGDCTLGSDESFNTTTNFDAFDAVNGHSYFFQNVRDILANDDVTFANLEGTLTESTARANKQYAFKGDPSYTEVLTSGSVEVVTLANNHSDDYGEQSLEDTRTNLTGAGIDYCTGDTVVYRDVNGIRTAFIGIYVLNQGMGCEQQVRDTIEAAKTQGAKLIVVAFHWGTEKAEEPDETQKSLAHTAVDCGANLVVGHHPHVLQPIEKYNGAYIVYSLGNFCFGGNSAPSDTDTIIFRQTFTFDDGKLQDDGNIEVIPCSITSAQGYNNYQPVPATGTEAERIITRLNELSEVYGQSFTAGSGLS